MFLRVLIAAALSILSAQAALAQALQCRVPEALPIAPPPQPGERRVVPVGGYTLSLSWSPEYCRTRGRSPADRFQCEGAGGRFGFILHGLWPEGKGAAWPQYCRPVAPVPEPVVRRHLCATPSVRLLQHEYAKHGSCMPLSAERYFAIAGMIHGALRYPDMDALSREQGLTAARFARAFAAANPGVDAKMLAVHTNRRGWLEDVRLCLDTRLKPRRCRPDRRAAGDADPIRIWRGGR